MNRGNSRERLKHALAIWDRTAAYKTSETYQKLRMRRTGMPSNGIIEWQRSRRESSIAARMRRWVMTISLQMMTDVCFSCSPTESYP